MEKVYIAENLNTHEIMVYKNLDEIIAVVEVNLLETATFIKYGKTITSTGFIITTAVMK